MDKSVALLLFGLAIMLGPLLVGGLICALNPPPKVLARKVVGLIRRFSEAEAVVSAYAQVLQQARPYPTSLRPLSELPAPKESIIAAFHLVGLRDALIGRLDVKLADLKPAEGANWGGTTVRDGLVLAHGHLADFVPDNVAQKELAFHRALSHSIALQQQGASAYERAQLFCDAPWPAEDFKRAGEEFGDRAGLFRGYLAAAEGSIRGVSCERDHV
jgi:hypothetical protein